MHNVSFELAGGAQPLVIVPTWVNGQGPFQFILDTGAGTSLVDPRLAQRLGVQAGETKEGRVAGGSVTVSLGRLESLAVGAAKVEDLQVALLDLSDLSRATGVPIDGDIGYDFLKHFSVTLDYQGRRLRLGESDGATPGIDFRLGQPSKPLVLVPVTVNGKGPFQFALDTGASTSILAPELARDLQIATQPGPPISTGGGHTAPVFTGHLDTLAVGEATARDLPVLVAGFLEMLSQVVGAKLDGILGYNFLQGFEVTLDYPGRKLRLL